MKKHSSESWRPKTLPCKVGFHHLPSRQPAFYGPRPPLPTRPVCVEHFRGVSLLPPSRSSTAFQHGLPIALQKAEPFLDLAEGWSVYPEHSAAASDARNLPQVYSQHGVLPTLHLGKGLHLL